LPENIEAILFKIALVPKNLTFRKVHSTTIEELTSNIVIICLPQADVQISEDARK